MGMELVQLAPNMSTPWPTSTREWVEVYEELSLGRKLDVNQLMLAVVVAVLAL